MQRDTDGLDETDTYDRRREAAEANKKQRRELSVAGRTTPSGNTANGSTNNRNTPSTTTSSSISVALEAGMKKANEISALRALIECGSAEDKQAALQKLKDLV